MENGGVEGLRLVRQTGTLAEAPGSPIFFGSSNGFSQAGPVAAAKGHVYVGFGPPNYQPPVIRSYKVDPSTGSLGTFSETGGGSVQGDQQLRALVTDPGSRNLYAVYSKNITSFQINSDGSLTNLGTLQNLTNGFMFSLTIDPAANFAFLGVYNCPPQGPPCVPPFILLLSRDPNTGLLANTGKSTGLTGTPTPGALAIDPSGHHLFAATVGTSARISVFNINSNGSLSRVRGSPFSTPGGLPAVAFGFDATGHLLYVLNNDGFSVSQPESVAVYTIIQQIGLLQLLQNRALPAGNRASAFLVDSSFVFVVNQGSGPKPGVVYVLRRDPNTGMVSAPVFTHTEQQPLAPGDAVELRL